MRKKLLFKGMLIFMVLIISGCGKAGSYYQDGKNSFTNGNYEKAAESFTAAIKENPNRANYYIDYGMTLIELGQYEEALKQFDCAYMDKDVLVVKRNNKRVHRGRGITYYRMQKYTEAIEEFREALEIDELSDLDVDILYYMGNALMATGCYEKAIASYNIVLSMESKNAIAYNSRALCYRNIKEYEKSLADYDTAISLDPKQYDYYFGKYDLLVEKGDQTGSADVLKLALEIKVVTSEDKYNQAKVHYYQGDYEAALSELSEGFADGFTEAYYYIGEIYRIKKDYQKAIYYYETYIKEEELLEPSVYNQIAFCLIKSGEYKTALEYLELGIAYNQAGTLQLLKKNEIIAYEGMGLFDKAKGKLEEYLVDYPEDKEAQREAEFIKTRLIDTTTVISE